MYITFLLIALGLLSALVLFFRFPFAPQATDKLNMLKISVIIPARNEEKCLPLLLKDLKTQTLLPYEVICADDCSSDKTAEIAKSFGAKVISVKEKPDNWLGKSYACYIGSKAAEGEIYLFLDADVRLGKNGLEKIAGAYQAEKTTVSFQPYHKTEKLYEQFSLFFNLIQFAANGLSNKNGKHIGLYGPVIMICRDDYETVGGHKTIRESVIDDIALGLELKKHDLPFKLFMGDRDIYFRMYSGGFSDLFRGWLKNIAFGAVKTPFLRFLMIFLFITSCVSVVLNMAIESFSSGFTYLTVFSFFYILWVIILTRAALKIGSFSFISILFYPIPLFMFLTIFVLAVVKKIFHLKTVWKGRKV